jgi:hypothetical protein
LSTQIEDTIEENKRLQQELSMKKWLDWYLNIKY